MTCYHPLQAFKLSEKSSETGKHVIRFKLPKAPHEPLELPCGQCIGCRLDRSRQWAIRCLHEARLYDDNCFITLTFNDDNLYKRENPYSVDVRDFQLFMKRLRKRFGSGIRFFHCGEYGETSLRPHYHACIFNFDFPDKQLWKVANGNRLYVSSILEELWPFGFSTIGDVTFDSAAYVARYIMKKINGDQAFDHYNDYCKQTGEIFLTRQPEYTTMSRRPGIGKGWIDSNMDDVYVNGHGKVLMNKRMVNPPRFYDNQFEILYPEELEALKLERQERAEENADNNTPERLRVREHVKACAIKLLRRSVE